MKKIICLLTVLLLCMSVVVPAFAAEGDFVPSITYKPNPEIVPVKKSGKVVDYKVVYCDNYLEQMLEYGQKYATL